MITTLILILAIQDQSTTSQNQGKVSQSTSPPVAITVKPPSSGFNKVTNRGWWSTGEIKLRSFSTFFIYAGFGFPGTTPAYPYDVGIEFATRRSVDSRDNGRPDSDMAQWADVKHVVLRWGEKPVELDAKYSRRADTDPGMRALVGRSFVESLVIRMPIDAYFEMAKSEEIFLQLGTHSDSIKGGALKNIKRLADAITALGKPKK